MRTALVLVALALAMPRDADACFEPGFEQHELDRSQLADSVQPGPVSVSMWIESPGNGGCSAPSVGTRCEASGRRLVVMVSASDDRTPPDKLGYRVTITAGTAPFPAPGDVRPIGDLLSFPIADDAKMDFELAIRAIDLNGNIGPPTYTQIDEAASGEGCASHQAGALSFGMIAIVVGFLLRRRR